MGTLYHFFRNMQQRSLLQLYLLHLLKMQMWWNKIGDSVLDDYLVTLIERDIFFEVDEADIMETFMSIRHRRPDKDKDKDNQVVL